ncbi:MAG: hypothetical protein WDO16_06895 [Bacteroidota bacterium]
MRVRFEEIPDLSSSQVLFYSIVLGDDELSEFDKFDALFSNDNERSAELNIIYHSIHQISLRGAKKYFFRHEGPASALPGRSFVSDDDIENSPDFGLRLYAVVVNDGLVFFVERRY